MKTVFKKIPKCSVSPREIIIEGIDGTWAYLSDLSEIVKFYPRSDVHIRNFTGLHHLVFPNIKMDHRAPRFTSYETLLGSAAKILYENESARGFLKRFFHHGDFNVIVPFKWAVTTITAMNNGVIRVQILSEDLIKFYYLPDPQGHFYKTSTVSLSNIRRCVGAGRTLNPFVQVPIYKERNYVNTTTFFNTWTGEPFFEYAPK